MKYIAVLGSEGQLGKTLQYLVNQESCKYKFYSKQDVDITNRQSIESAFAQHSFNFCVNCAAYTDVEAAEKDNKEAFLINVEGAKNVADTCREKNIKLIHISTDYVFDGKKRTPYTISDKTNPINEYGKSKLKGEYCIKEALKEHYIIRTSWLYSVYGRNFFKTIVKRIGENNSLKVTTEEIGTPTSCIDLSHFIFHIVNEDNLPFGIYNFSAQGSTTWYGFAKEIVKNLYPDRQTNISPTDNFKTIAKRPKYSVLDNIETQRVYKKFKKWEESLKEVINKLID